MSIHTESRSPSGLLIAAGVALLAAGCAPEAAEPEEAAEDEARIRGHIAGRVAHHLCAGVFVVGRDYEPTVVERRTPDPAMTAWPTGNAEAHHDAPPAEVDMAALDWAMAQREHHTHALVVVYTGMILGER